MHRGTDSIHILNAADLSPHKKLSAGASVERSALFGIKWSPDGRRIASGGRFHQVHCWDAQTGDLLWEHNDVVAYTINVAWSPDGKRLAGGGRNGMLYIWDGATGEPVISHKRHVSAICQADISDDGRYAITAGAGGDVCTWRMEAPGSPMALTDVTYRPGGALFAAGSDVAAIALDQAGTVEVVDVGATRSAGRFNLPSPPIYTGLGAGGRSLVVIDKEGMLRRVDFGGKVLAEVRALPKNSFDYLMAWRSDDSRWVATAVGQATELHYVPTGQFRNIEQSNTLRSNGYGWGRYQGLAFSPDNACFAMIADRTVQVIETDSLKTVLELETGPDSPTALRFSPTGRVVAVGTSRGRVLLFSAMSGRQIHAFAGHEPEGWRAGRKRSGGGSTSPLDDEPYSICHLRYEQAGKRLLSGSADHTVLIWDTSAHGGPEPVAGDKNAGQLWALLGSDDASEAWQAAWAFGAMGHQGAVFLADKLRPADRASRAKVLRLVQQLRSRKFAARKAAQDELEQIASQSVEVLESLVEAGDLPPELLARVKKLIDEAGAVTTTTTAALQKWRGIRVLERIGTPSARQVLLGLSRGAKGSHLTQLAIGALERMGR
jgi:WD40 repeat protein